MYILKVMCKCTYSSVIYIKNLTNCKKLSKIKLETHMILGGYHLPLAKARQLGWRDGLILQTKFSVDNSAKRNTAFLDHRVREIYV